MLHWFIFPSLDTFYRHMFPVVIFIYFTLKTKIRSYWYIKNTFSMPFLYGLVWSDILLILNLAKLSCSCLLSLASFCKDVLRPVSVTSRVISGAFLWVYLYISICMHLLNQAFTCVCVCMCLHCSGLCDARMKKLQLHRLNSTSSH